ncbi:MAG: RecX family transcriptional regulator [Acetobacteraceae bacterium]|nr:RecX family transcriptional regulator [Acetobacteraceae bacterium]
MPSRPSVPAPDRAALHEAALQHLSRYAATEAGLVRVLERRIARWERGAGVPPGEAGASREAAREVARALAASGAVDDAVFAQARARRLLRSGRSRLAVSAHLAAKGVDAAVAERVLPERESELAAAMAFARRRRIGPFRTADADAERRQRELAALGRAGFPREIAEQVLRTDRDTAEALVTSLKQG